MITVYVWLPKQIGNQKNVGHAAMSVGGRAYISWWPDEAAGLGRNYYPMRNKSHLSDVKDEGCPPDYKVDLNGLNEQAVLDWWSSFGLVQGRQVLHGPMLPYNFAKQNCSTVVALALKKADGDTYANWFNSWSIVWRPDTVLQ